MLRLVHRELRTEHIEFMWLVGGWVGGMRSNAEMNQSLSKKKSIIKLYPAVRTVLLDISEPPQKAGKPSSFTYKYTCQGNWDSLNNNYSYVVVVVMENT